MNSGREMLQVADSLARDTACKAFLHRGRTFDLRVQGELERLTNAELTGDDCVVDEFGDRYGITVDHNAPEGKSKLIGHNGNWRKCLVWRDNRQVSIAILF